MLEPFLLLREGALQLRQMAQLLKPARYYP